jgi:uncharacterized Zn finger protein (UPF0148 family)
MPDYIDHCPRCKQLTHYRQRADGSWHCGRCGRDAVQAMPQEEAMATIRRLLEQSEEREASRRGTDCHSDLGDGTYRQHRPDALQADATTAAWAQPV